MEREMEIRSIGLRDVDLQRAGLFPDGGFSSEAEHRSALIRLSVSTLRAETEAAEAQLEAAVKELESVRIALAELTIYSPAAGTIGARYLEEGERVKKEDKLCTLMETNSLYVIFALKETDALRLSEGMAAKVTVDGAGGIYDGTVDLVSPQADSQSFTFTVRVLLPRAVVGAEEKLRPGMFARVTVRLGSEKPILMVPETAVVNRKDDQGTVFVIHQGIASEREIRFGLLAGSNREIRSGLKAGEVVTVKPEAMLREGSHVIPE
jgi:RND family efflux transporter MFP subunit